MGGYLKIIINYQTNSSYQNKLGVVSSHVIKVKLKNMIPPKPWYNKALDVVQNKLSDIFSTSISIGPD